MATMGVTRSGIFYPTGWVDDHKAVDRVMGSLPHPVFGITARPIQDTGKGKVTLLFQAVRKVVGKDLCHTQTIGDCFPAGTTVLGEKTKSIEDVRVGDLVWTGEGKLTHVVSTRAIETNRPLVRINSVGGLPTTVTADHEFLVYRMARVHGKRVTSAYYKRALGGKSQGRLKVRSVYEARKPEWVAAGDLTDTDCLLTPVRFAKVPVPADVYRDAWKSVSGRRMLGYFLGNGHASGGSVEFSISSEEVSDELHATLESLGLNPKRSDYRDDCGAWRIRVHDVGAVAWFRSTFYDEAGVKSFPGWAIGDADFIAGLRAADGLAVGEKADAIDSTSASIISATIASLVALGYEPTVSRVAPSEGTYDNAKPLWRVIWRQDKQKVYVWRDEEFVCRPVRSIRFIEGTSTVYDIGVADTHHSFLANTFAAHNCVSHGHSLSVDVLKCVQIDQGQREKFTGETATEVMYAGARIEIGQGGCGRGDGAVGAWAAQFETTYGTLVRGKYGSVDLTTYDGNRARAWGAPGQGVPTALEPTIHEHPVKTTSLVQTYEEARDALANGYPVAVCSNRGFTMSRDQDGFAKPKGVWGHCMCFLACDDSFSRPGLLCMNSWGADWIDGPKRLDQPEGSFWVDAEVANDMLGQQDSFALSGFAGFPSQAIDYDFLA